VFADQGLVYQRQITCASIAQLDDIVENLDQLLRSQFE